MATLAVQPITLAGLTPTLVSASGGGDRFTPGADVLLYLTSTAAGPVTVTVSCVAPVLDEDVADVVVTVPAGGRVVAGPFSAQFFADPVTGLALVSYSDAAHTQVGAVGFTRGGWGRGTLVTTDGGTPSDLPSGSLWATTGGELYLTPSGSPGSGVPVASGATAPTDLPDGTVYVQVVGGVAQSLYLTPGVSALDIAVTGVAPADLAANQLRVVLGSDGSPTDLYIGGM